MHNPRVYWLLFIIVLLTGCAQPDTQQTFILADAQPPQRVTLIITLQNARDQNGALRDGTLAITSLNDGQRSMLQITTTGTVAPIWLTSVDNNAVFVTANQTRRIVDGTCTRDAGGFPPVSIRDILGPLQGFISETNTVLRSTQGGAAWQRFDAEAYVDDQGALTRLNGQGQGKVLLPGGDVITADMEWDYVVEAYPVMVVIPSQQCEAVGFSQISFPTAFGTATTMGGALLFTYTDTLEQTQDVLLQHWQSLGLSPQITDQNQQSVIIELTVQQQRIRAFLVQSTPQTTAITVISIAQ
jgi:hypothetical protein